MQDIENIEDIKFFVDTFYEKIRDDELLAPIFGMRLHAEDWEKHLQRMYDFWHTVLFFQGTYKGNPFSKHATLPIHSVHFARWIALFEEVIDASFCGNRATETKMRANKMATLFMTKLSYLNDNQSFRTLL